jgi:predicted DNA-binding transcriptional regulator AlpA
VPQQSVLLTQRDAAKILGVDRVTVWRMTCNRILHPVELLSGTVRYRREEIVTLATSGWKATAKTERDRAQRGRRGADNVS